MEKEKTILRISPYPTNEESGRGLHPYEISKIEKCKVIYLTFFKENTNRISVLYVNDEMKANAMKITSSLRENNVPTDIDLSGRALKKQMENSIQSKFSIIVGPDEFSNGMVVVRNMSDRSENKVKISELLEYVNNSLM